jgi:hypothetical protein
MPALSRAEVAEGVRATIAVYTQALDDGRTDDLVATFCADGGCDIPGVGSPKGHAALRQAFAALEPSTPQRHLVVNTAITGWGDDEVTAISDFVFLVPGDPLWGVRVVGRYQDTLHRDGTRWLFHQRTIRFVPSDPSDRETP